MTERDDKGRFVPGTTGNPAGRPRRAVEERMLRELGAKLDRNGTLPTILDKVIDEAKNGKEWAVRFVFEYMVGKPVQRTEQRIELRDLLDSWASGDISDTPPAESST